MKYEYKYASEEDGEEISALLENIEFKGEISLAYCRRPNAVLSLSKEGDKSIFVIVRDGNGKIIGTGACIIKGDIAYLTGLRAVKLANIPKCYELLCKFCRSNGVRITYTTILEDNIGVQKMLEKQRPNMPNYIRHSEYTVNIIRKNLHINDKNKLLKKGDTYILQNQQNEEIARGKAVIQWDYKQYIIKHYSIKMRIAKIFLKWIPDENKVLKFFTLREVITKDNAALKSFLKHMSQLPLEGSFFLYGGADCPVKSFKYKSIVYIVDWNKSISNASDIKIDIEISDL